MPFEHERVVLAHQLIGAVAVVHIERLHLVRGHLVKHLDAPAHALDLAGDERDRRGLLGFVLRIHHWDDDEEVDRKQHTEQHGDRDRRGQFLFHLYFLLVVTTMPAAAVISGITVIRRIAARVASALVMSSILVLANSLNGMSAGTFSLPITRSA